MMVLSLKYSLKMFLHGRSSPPAIVDCCVYFSHPRVLFHTVKNIVEAAPILLHVPSLTTYPKNTTKIQSSHMSHSPHLVFYTYARPNESGLANPLIGNGGDSTTSASGNFLARQRPNT